MTSFVLEIEKSSYTQTEKYRIIEWENKCQAFDKIINYAKFLKQPLKLEMFVPCDEEGNIISKFYSEKENTKNLTFSQLSNQYQIAETKVLFEGFNLNQKDFSKLESIFCLTKECFQITFFTNEKGCFMDNLKTNKTYEIKTIEDLIQFKLELTASAIKQIGL